MCGVQQETGQENTRDEMKHKLYIVQDDEKKTIQTFHRNMTAVEFLVFREVITEIIETQMSRKKETNKIK